MDKQPSKIQIELLTLITAKPYGQGLKVKQAAKLLHIKYDSACYQLKKFRASFPDRWAAIKGLRIQTKTQKKLERAARRSLKNPTLIGALDFGNDSSISEGSKLWIDDGDLSVGDDSITSKIAYLKIKEKF